MTQLVRTPARRPRDAGSNPSIGKNLSPKLLLYNLPDGYSESYILMKVDIIRLKGA